MSKELQDYRKLSGKWRGLSKSAAVYGGQDSLLVIQQAFYRERLVRLHYRDIQAIAVSDQLRFVLSRAQLFLFLSMLLTSLIVWYFSIFWSAILAIVAAGAVAWWLYLSAARSCRCVIHTAVSQIELPSIFRRNEANRFLTEVTPLIQAAQGPMPADWNEIVTDSSPAEVASLASASPAELPAASGTRQKLALVSLMLLLLMDAVLTIRMIAASSGADTLTHGILSILQAAAIIWAILESRYSAKPLRYFTISVTLFFGVTVVVQTIIMSALAVRDLKETPFNSIFLNIYVGGCIALLCAGAVVLLKLSRREQHA